MSILTTRTLSLAVADEISSLVVKAALANKFNPISVCILDNAGNEIVSKRMDGCPAVAYPKISFAKANTCIAVKSSSRSYGKKYLKNADGSSVGPETFARVLNQIQIVDGNMACFQGGVLIREKETGEILGSVGVSGAAGNQDEYCALYGIQNCAIGASLVTEPATHSLEHLPVLE